MEQAKKELKGKFLGCWCKPEACHGDVIAEIVDGRLTGGETKVEQDGGSKAMKVKELLKLLLSPKVPIEEKADALGEHARYFAAVGKNMSLSPRTIVYCALQQIKEEIPEDKNPSFQINSISYNTILNTLNQPEAYSHSLPSNQMETRET